MIEVEVFFFRLMMAIDLGRFEKQDGLVLHQRHADTGGDFRHLAAVRRGHEMFHLHGFEHRDLLAGAHEVAFADFDRDDGALQRRRHRHGTSRSGFRPHNLGCITRSTGRFEQQRLGNLIGRAHQSSDMRIDETGADAVGGKFRMRQHGAEERNVGGDAADAEFAQGARGLLHHVGPLRPRRMNDDFCKQ